VKNIVTLTNSRVFEKEKLTREIIEGKLLMFNKQVTNYYRFNEMGTRIWLLINGKRDIKNIKDKIKKEYLCPDDKILDKKINKFLQILIKEGLIK
jgi:hypothetical protein